LGLYERKDLLALKGDPDFQRGNTVNVVFGNSKGRRGKAIVLLIALLAVAGLCGSSFAREYSVADVVGDSVSDGVNPDCYPLLERYGWVHMLYGMYGTSNSPPQLTITNLWPSISRNNSAVSGSRAWEWADTISYPYLTNVISHHPDLVFVMIGGNDFLSYVSDGVVTPEESAQYQTNLTTIIETLQGQTPVPEIVMIGYYDLFDGYSTNPLVPSAYRTLSQAVPAANTMIRDIALAHGCFFVSVYEDFMHHAYGAELGDTNHLAPDYVRTPLANFDIHPVTAGHLEIYDLVYARLQEFKEIPKFAELRVESGHPVVRWSSGIAQEYIVECSTNLVLTNGFSPLSTNWSTPPLNTHTDTVNNAERMFYRIRVK
jgi:lysophospholipase L1-like esterase